MKVKVRCFASLRDATGIDVREVILPDEARFDSLMSILEQELPGEAMEALRADNVRVALNQELTEPPFELAEGDEVAFMPPVTGG